MVKLLLASSASIEAPGEDGRALSFRAVQSDRSDVAELHASRDGNCCTTGHAGATLLRSTDHDGNTPLLAASRDGQFEVVHVLLNAGASPVARAADGETVLISAARFGD